PQPPPPPAWIEDVLRALGAIAPIFKFVFWGGLALGAALVLWFVAREIWETRLNRKPAAVAPADWRPEPAAARAPLAAADRLASAGRLRDAIPPLPCSPRAILALVVVGLVSFSALAVLAAYAPELRGAADPGAHALSSSAIGFRGAIVMLRAEGVPVVISRAVPRSSRGDETLL